MSGEFGLRFELRVNGRPVAEAGRFTYARRAAVCLAVEHDAEVQTVDTATGRVVLTTWMLPDGTPTHRLAQGTQARYEREGCV